MLNRTQRMIRSIALGASIVVAGLCGCHGSSAVGTDFTLSISRTLRACLSAEIGTTHAVALDVLGRDLAYTVTDAGLDAREGVILAETARGNRIRVETHRLADEATEVEIYVGPGGDLATELAILNGIEARLPIRLAANAD